MAFISTFAPPRPSLCTVSTTTRPVKPPVTPKRPRVRMQQDSEEDKDIKLQKSRSVVLRDFGKIAAAAFGIGLLLFFFDILVSLVVLSVGFIYAIAVLLQVRGVDGLLSRTVQGVVTIWKGLKGWLVDGYRAIRRQVRKGLED